MRNKKTESSINIKGPVIGIGNIVGSQSSSHVEINLFSKNQVFWGENKTVLQRNPNFTAEIGRAFSPHPDATLPELEHLIGHEAELNRLLELYDYVGRQKREVFVFITGQYGFGTKALGRAFVDAVRLGNGRTAITRFWPEENEMRSRRDVRWNLGFQRWQEVFELAPEFLKQEGMFPFWGLFFQLFEKITWLENEPLPAKLNDLPAYFRVCAQSGKPLVLLLEDFENATADWHKLIRYLSKEADHALPILWIIPMHTDRPINEIPEENLTSSQVLALELTKDNIAEVYHLSRITKQDIESYVSPTERQVAERLHCLTDGVPILIQNLWQDWQRSNTVFQNDQGYWVMNAKSPWMEYGSGRDYVHAMLDQLWVEDEAPWSTKKMYEMLALAAMEGQTFTVEALAKVFDIEPEVLSSELEYLLDEPDDPGLIKESEPIHLELKNANWKRTLDCFEFSPLLVWYSLTTYEKPDNARIISYAECLRESIWPFIECFARRITNLYDQASRPDMAEKYRRLTLTFDEPRKLMLQAELLLEFPESEIAHARLHEIAIQLFENSVACTFSRWTMDFTSRLAEIFEKSKRQYFLGLVYWLLAHSMEHLGEYVSAREYYEKSLAIEENLERKPGISIALGGLGNLVRRLGEYAIALEYFERMLAIEVDLSHKGGIAHALDGLGNVEWRLGRYAKAREYFGKMLEIEEDLGLKVMIAVAMGGLAGVAASLGEYANAREFYQRKLAIDEELENKVGIADALQGLGNIATSLGEYAIARENYERYLVIEEELEHKVGIAQALAGLGNIAVSLGAYQVAREYFEKELAIAEELGRSDEIATALSGLGDVAKSLGDYQAAQEYYEKTFVIAEELERKDVIATALSGLGDVASSLGEYQAARGYYEKMLAIEEELGRKAGIAVALGGLGDVASSLGEYQAARGYYERKLAIDEELGRKGGIANSLRGLGNLANSVGEYSAAKVFLEKTLIIEEELGRKKEIAETLYALGEVAVSVEEKVSAQEYLNRALKIYEAMGTSEIQKVRQSIEALEEIKRSKDEPKT